MSGSQTRNERSDGAATYAIRVRGHLDSRWETWFDGLTLIRDSDGSTLIQGAIPDQSALHGLLHKIRDLGLPLVSVIPLDPR